MSKENLNCINQTFQTILNSKPNGRRIPTPDATLWSPYLATLPAHVVVLATGIGFYPLLIQQSLFAFL